MDGGSAATLDVKFGKHTLQGIYQEGVKGKWRLVKDGILGAVMIGGFIVPWIRWDRGPDLPDQAILISFATSRSYFFDFTFWPQDLYIVTALLLASAFGLFFTNSIVGRAWCGFTCPQTVWADLFFKIERLIEGDRNQRLRRNVHGVSAGGIARKSAKHLFWGLAALITGLTVMSYVVDAPTLWSGFFTGDLGTASFVLVLVFAVLTYVLAGFAREKVCLYMCPWPRFQSAMLDIDTKTVAYKEFRGEPRGKASVATNGDCIDCHKCVHVCPMGIDIRNGFQLSCIGCALCIDACDEIMNKVGRDRGLIDFISDRDLADGTRAKLAAAGGEASAIPLPHKEHVGLVAQHETAEKPKFRPRTIGYGVMMTLAGLVALVALFMREVVIFDVSPEREPPFVLLSDGSIKNNYNVRFTDRRNTEVEAVLRVSGLDGATFSIAQAGITGGANDVLEMTGTETEAMRLSIVAPPGSAPSGRQDISLQVVNSSNGEVLASERSYFWGPER